MNEEEKIDQMRRYWLGFLTEGDRCAFEAAWFDNDEESELLAAVRDDLIQDYLAGELDNDELMGFQTNLLGQLDLVQEVTLSAAISRVLAVSGDETDTNRLATKIGWVAQVTSVFRQFVSGGVPAAAFGAIITVLLIGGGVVWRSLTINLPKLAIVQLPDTNQDVRVTNEDSSVYVEPPQPEQPSNKKQPPPATVYPKTRNQDRKQDSYVALVLGPVLRSQGVMPEKSIPKGVRNLRIVFQKPNILDSYNKYSVKIVSADSGLVFGQQRLQDLSKIKTGGKVSVTVPKRGLVPGEYKLVIFGETSSSQNDQLWERTFRILKP
ncbi:MAG: hypothetical protein IPL32_05830 [Chloracidobacterium sp.]|nr:hypothetical protein [Chloracidobacterium sp.]